MLAREPGLQLIGADDLADDDVVRAVIAVFRGLARQRPRFVEDEFVRVDQSTQLLQRRLAAAGDAREPRLLHQSWAVASATPPRSWTRSASESINSSWAS